MKIPSVAPYWLDDLIFDQNCPAYTGILLFSGREKILHAGTRSEIKQAAIQASRKEKPPRITDTGVAVKMF